MLTAPPDAAAQHVEALLALACMRPAAGASPQAASQAGEPPSHYLRTVHMDLSSHELSMEQLRDLLLEAPWRLRQCLMWHGLVLAGCGLKPGAATGGRLGRSGWGSSQRLLLPSAGLKGCSAPHTACSAPACTPLHPSCCSAPLYTPAEALSLLEDWRVMRLMGHLKRLVLADNPLLGRDPAAPGQCLGPLDTDWLEGRLLQAASLELLDLRRTGARLAWPGMLASLAAAAALQALLPLPSLAVVCSSAISCPIMLLHLPLSPLLQALAMKRTRAFCTSWRTTRPPPPSARSMAAAGHRCAA